MPGKTKIVECTPPEDMLFNLKHVVGSPRHVGTVDDTKYLSSHLSTVPEDNAAIEAQGESFNDIW